MVEDGPGILGLLDPSHPWFPHRAFNGKAKLSWSVTDKVFRPLYVGKLFWSKEGDEEFSWLAELFLSAAREADDWSLDYKEDDAFS